MLAAPLAAFLELTDMKFREPPAQPGSSQHDNFQKAPVDSVEFACARNAAAVFFANEGAAFQVEPLQPGNSGMWPFQVTTDTQPYLLKIASPNDEINVEKQAERARWAGAMGLGPVVCGEDRANKAYVTHCIDGHVLNHEQAAGEKKAAIARAMRRLHTADASELNASGFVAGAENWLFRQDLAKCLRGSADARTRLFADELVALYRRTDKKLGEMNYAKTPIHDDVKADNAFAVDQEVIFTDWDNLKVGDPMVDLAHFLWSVDAPVSSTKSFLSDDYGHDAASSSEQDEALVRLQLRLFQVRLRSFAFFGQYGGNAPNTRYYQYLLKEDIAAILPLI